MPELPEVETIRRSLAPCIGAKIAAVDVWQWQLRKPVDRRALRSVVGRRIDQLLRRGKYLLVGLSDEQVLLLHFGMSGTLRIAPPEAQREEHDHLQLVLGDGRRLVLNDPRRFGLVWAGKLEETEELAQLGPDALSDDFTPEYLYRSLRRFSRAIKNVLLDQRVVAGIGNIYANEALFVAGLRPGRPARRLTCTDAARLHAALRTTLSEAIAAGGSSIADFHDGNGRPGYFQLCFRVYDREGEPCITCGRAIRRVILTGRSSFFCPGCQH